MLRNLWVSCALLLMVGCSSYGVVQNRPESAPGTGESYSLSTWSDGLRSGDILLLLAFSGGGTRAAALSYGVLEELHDTTVVIDGRSEQLLEEVDGISSVSGGSFTAAYYGLYGNMIFKDFEELFLKSNVEGDLLRSLFNPLRWFSSKGRTEMAVQYYEKTLFRGATYADMLRENHPIILINASDLGYGVRFSFIQEYFSLLCSDLRSFPVARAVTASSAVPVLFNPVVVENFSDCGNAKPDWLAPAQDQAADDPQMSMLVHGLETYLRKDERKYAHFVDGGITDNLGLRAIYDVVELAGGVREFRKARQQQPPKHIVLISVNASTNPEPEMDKSNKQPSLEEALNAMSDVQLHRYNATTLELMKETLARWAQELSTPKQLVDHHFIQLSFEHIQQPETRLFLNRIPTSFSLSDEQVDKAIEAGHLLLRDNPNYRRLLAEFGWTQ
ncbi:MAG: patatin-like phospholipase family protein [Candidatus Thiodiazotropha sp. (ex Lucinoma borealis)]|nr:patatin-like phospholipase family protein [Candidatus Thiodiazotropha sp. (ex Lucinoma borealis)]